MNLLGSIALLNLSACISRFSSLLNESKLRRGMSNQPLATSEPCFDAFLDDFVNLARGISPHLSVVPARMGRSSGLLDTWRALPLLVVVRSKTWDATAGCVKMAARRLLVLQSQDGSASIQH